MDRRDLTPSLFRSGSRPGDVFSALQQEVGRVFDTFMREPLTVRLGGNGSFMPSVDVVETNDGFDVTAELPGCDAKDVEVSVIGRTLTLKGEKKTEKETSEKDWHMSERSYGAFVRSIPLAFDVDPEKVSASFDKGVLKVHLPKPPEAKPEKTRIEIKS